MNSLLETRLNKLISDAGNPARSQLVPEASEAEPILGTPAAVFGAYGAVTLVLDAFDRGRQTG